MKSLFILFLLIASAAVISTKYEIHSSDISAVSERPPHSDDGSGGSGDGK